MDFKFEVNENLLIHSALLGKKSRFFIARDLKNKLYEKYPLPYELRGDSRKLFASDDIKTSFEELATQTADLFNEFKESSEYDELLKETENYKEKLEKEWKEKKNEVLKHLKDILKIDLPTKVATVFVIPPSIGGGMYLGDMKIFWGHGEDWENYSMVYLVHEYMHSFVLKGDFTHAVIELATDNELRIRLNKKGEYFKENGQPIGHENLRTLEEMLLPKWKDYLKNEEEDIYEFIKKNEV